MIDLDPRSKANIYKADRQLERSGVSYPNALFDGGAEEVHEVFNTQGYGYALIDPDGKTEGTHLEIKEIEESLAKMLKGEPAKAAGAQP